MDENLTLSGSIISADFLKIGEQIDELMESECNEIHFDVMDGHFVPNLSAGPVILGSIKTRIKCKIDVHLMVRNPLVLIEEFSDAGADIITFHIESDDEPINVIDKIKEYDMSPAIALKPETSWIEMNHLIEYLDRVLFMTVTPGASGRSFKYDVLDKIKMFIKFNQAFLDKKKHFQIGVDGGISKETAILAVNAGARVLVSGSSIFWNKNKTISECVAEIMKSIKKNNDIIV